MALAPTRSRKQRSYNSVAAVWTPEEDQLLTQLVQNETHVKWTEIAKNFPTKTAPQVSGRWIKALKPDLIKGSWTREEDEAIFKFIEVHGDKDWSKLAQLLPGRIGKQCRERWINHLNPAITRSRWTEEEDQLLIKLHNEYGNAWAKIAKHFNGRTDNCVKNRWNSTLKRRLERIARGEPAVRKRGRKPKKELQKLAEQNKIGASPPESPVIPDVSNVAEIFPISVPFLGNIPSLVARDSSVQTLEESRSSLYQLLR